MPLREKDRDLRRKKRRRQKIGKLKSQLTVSKDLERKRQLIEKIRRIHPWVEIPE